MANADKSRASPSGQRPEALAQFAKSARKQAPGKSTATLVADAETAPMLADNADKHGVATELLHEGATGRLPDPEEAGAKELPDRIVDSRPKGFLKRLLSWQ